MEGVVLTKLPVDRETPRTVAFGHVKRQKKRVQEKVHPTSISVLTDTIHSTISCMHGSIQWSLPKMGASVFPTAVLH